MFIILLLLFTATVTPFEVAFLETSLNGLFVVNRVVDVSFIIVKPPYCVYFAAIVCAPHIS